MTKYWYFANQYGRLAAILKIYAVIYFCKYLSDCCQILQCCSCLYRVMYDRVLILWISIWPTGGHLEFLKIYEGIYLCKYLSDCCQILQCYSCLYKVMYNQVLILLQINMADWRPSWIFANLRSDISLQVLKRLLSNFTMLFLSIQSNVWPSIDTLQINMADWQRSWIFANLRSVIYLQVLERLLWNCTMLFLSIQSNVWPSIDSFAN